MEKLEIKEKKFKLIYNEVLESEDDILNDKSVVSQKQNSLNIPTNSPVKKLTPSNNSKLLILKKEVSKSQEINKNSHLIYNSNSENLKINELYINDLIFNKINTSRQKQNHLNYKNLRTL